MVHNPYKSLRFFSSLFSIFLFVIQIIHTWNMKQKEFDRIVCCWFFVLSFVIFFRWISLHHIHILVGLVKCKQLIIARLSFSQQKCESLWVFMISFGGFAAIFISHTDFIQIIIENVSHALTIGVLYSIQMTCRRNLVNKNKFDNRLSFIHLLCHSYLALYAVVLCLNIFATVTRFANSFCWLGFYDFHVLL